MSLLEKLKAVFGGGSNRETGSSNTTSGTAGATSTGNTSNESAVKEPVDPAQSGGSTSEPSIEGSSSVDAVDETPDTSEAITEAETESTEEPADAENGSDDEVSVSAISGIGPAYSDRLESIGVETVGQLADAEPDDIAAQTDISIGRVSNWIERARNF
jgi:predicted flap endonuclease-1-like 5' DNA nuclease